MKYRFKSTDRTILILALYQILGGLIGFGVVFHYLIRTEAINGPLLLIFLIIIGLYSLSIKSGILLIRREFKRGLIYSMINQVAQIFAIGLGGYKLDYLSGLRLRLGFNFTQGFKFNFDFSITSTFNIGINSSDKEYFLYANFFAIILLFLLNDIYKEKFEKKLNIENNSESLDNEEDTNNKIEKTTT